MLPKSGKLDAKPYLYKPSCTRATGIVLSDADINDVTAEQGLVPRRVVRVYRNKTEEWVKLTWAEGGETKELIATPGHHFLDRFGNFPTIEEMLENGRATVILASGEAAEVTAERIIYSADTAHLFEQAQVAGMIAGNVAQKPAFNTVWS